MYDGVIRRNSSFDKKDTKDHQKKISKFKRGFEWSTKSMKFQIFAVFLLVFALYFTANAVWIFVYTSLFRDDMSTHIESNVIN